MPCMCSRKSAEETRLVGWRLMGMSDVDATLLRPPRCEVIVTWRLSEHESCGGVLCVSWGG